MTAPEASRPRSRPGQAERIVVICGVVSIAFGLGVVVITVLARPGVGSFGVVPEAIANAMASGRATIATVRPAMTSPRRSATPYP